MRTLFIFTAGFGTGCLAKLSADVMAGNHVDGFAVAMAMVTTVVFGAAAIVKRGQS